MVFGGAGGALDGEHRITADGGGEQLGEHRLGRARLAHQHQALAAEQGDDGAVHQGIVAVELAADAERLVTEDEASHRARRAQPAGRQVGAGLLVGLGQALQFLGEMLFRSLAENGAYHGVFFSHWGSKPTQASAAAR